MAKRLDQIIGVDLESTCWEGEPPPGEENEIIEVGICPLVVATGERLPKESILVKPIKSKVSPFCTQLTTLTQKDVDQGVTFQEAMQRLKEVYDTKNRVMASWGDYDRRQIERQCAKINFPSPLGPTHFNVKAFHALSYGLPRELGMDKAMEMMGIPLVGTHHRGHDDAANIMLILSKLLLDRGDLPHA